MKSWTRWPPETNTVRPKAMSGSTIAQNVSFPLTPVTSLVSLVLRVAVKPTPSIGKRQETVDIKKMQNTSLEVKGRHDACIVPRAVPVVESMMAITICDSAMRARLIPEVLK